MDGDGGARTHPEPPHPSKRWGRQDQIRGFVAALWGGRASGDSEGGTPFLPVPTADPGTAGGAGTRPWGRSQVSGFPTLESHPVPPAELPAQRLSALRPCPQGTPGHTWDVLGPQTGGSGRQCVGPGRLLHTPAPRTAAPQGMSRPQSPRCQGGTPASSLLRSPFLPCFFCLFV